MKRIIICTLIAMLLFSGNNSSAGEKESVKKAIVLAVFGTSHPKALKAILNIKNKMEQSFPEMPVRLAFTSEIIRKIWSKRATDLRWRNEHPEVPEQLYSVKNPLATIADLQDQGYRNIAVQTTHIFEGEEYFNLKSEIKALDSIQTLRYRDKPFKRLVLGRPALGENGDVYPYPKDIVIAVKALKTDVDMASKNRSALVYMGHGNEIFSTGAYVETEAAFRDTYPDVPVFIGNVEGFPGIEKVIKGLKHAGIKRVTLIPLMVVAGDHAANDMAGNEKGSWKVLLEEAGIEVNPVLRGLGEIESWIDIYVQHLKDAMSKERF